MPSQVQVDVAQLRSTAQAFRQFADAARSTNVGLWNLGLSFVEGQYLGNVQLLFGDVLRAVFDTPAKQIATQAEDLAQRLEQFAQRMEEADRFVEVHPTEQAAFDAWRNSTHWSVSQVDGKTILKTADGVEINLLKVVEGDADELEKYADFINDQALSNHILQSIQSGYGSPQARFARSLDDLTSQAGDGLTVAEEVVDGKWNHVNGYMRKNGTYVDDYWRRFPGGADLAQKFEKGGKILDRAMLAYSLHEAIRNNEREVIALPLGLGPTGEPIQFYYKPGDKWRGVVENVGSIAGGAAGAAGAGFLGIPTGPGAVAAGIAGGVGGGIAGEAAGGAVYDVIDRAFNNGEGAPMTNISFETDQICVDVPLDQGNPEIRYSINERGEPVIEQVK